MKLSFKELSGSTRLFLDYLFNYPRLSEFFNGNFNQLDSYRGIAEQVGKNQYPRSELAALLTDQNRGFGATSRTLENINSLKDGKTKVVFTGQQIGLFGGPLYTIYKSLTLLKLAKKLESELKTKVIPIFWMATDDHDFREINHIFFSDRQDKLVKLEYQPEKNWSGYPSSQILLDKNVQTTLEILHSGLKSAKFTLPVLEKLSDAYRPGRSYHLAFAHWMTSLLGKFGLILLNPADPTFKSLLKPIFKNELEMNGNLEKLIEQTSRNLESKNYHRQVRRKENLTNLFYHSPQRVNVTKENGSFGWQGNDRKLSGPEVIKILDQTPQNFSANVLLRPVLESFLFPNLSHVAGPSEIAYFAQTKPLHKEFGVSMPVVCPRRSLTLIEPKVKRILGEYNISLPKLNQDVEAVYSRLIEEKLPQDARQILDRTRKELKETVTNAGEKLLKLQPGLKQNLEFTVGKIDFEFNKFQEKFLQAYKKQFKQIKDELYLAHDSVFPQHELQERTHNITYYLTRHGFELIDILYDRIDLENPDHQIVELNG